MAKSFKFSVLALIGLLLSAASAFGAEFTQTDLEKMVKELDAVIPRNKELVYPIKCGIEESPFVNAYATVEDTEDGKLRAVMMLETGLIEYVNGDPRIIRAVVAHEVAHLSHGHMIAPHPISLDLGNLWTRQQEMEADRLGAQALQRLGYSKQDMVDMLLVLEKVRGREGNWLNRVSGTHPDPKARAAEISDNPSVLRSLVTFDIGLAMMQNRAYEQAALMFDRAAKQEPKLTDAYINSAYALTMRYWDELPLLVKKEWYRPDFGAMITAPRLPKGTAVTEEDRARYNAALDKLQIARSKAPNDPKVTEISGFLDVLHPDKDKTAVERGIATFAKLQAEEKDDYEKLRHANNRAVGLHQLGKDAEAGKVLIEAQKASEFYNKSLAENLGRTDLKLLDKDTQALAADVIAMWLADTSRFNANWEELNTKFQDVLKELNIAAPKIDAKPGFLCKAVALNYNGKDIGVYAEVDEIVKLIGIAEMRWTFKEEFNDLSEMRWNGGEFTILTERGAAMRLTSTRSGDYIWLRPQDETVQGGYKITVGMSKADFERVLSLDMAEPVTLSNEGQGQDWFYFWDLNMGVKLEGDKITGVTVASAEEPF